MSSFRSYVKEDKEAAERNEKLSKAYSKAYEPPEMDLKSRFLEGEQTVSFAKKVIRYNAYDDPSKGISGALVCTNFRLSFITAEERKFDLLELQNRLLGNNDIALNNVDSIFVEYANKRKKLIPGSRVKDGILRLEVHCKDFRIISFNFKLTLKGEEKTLVNSLLHHAYPSTVHLLFAFDYKHKYNLNNDCEIPLYRNTRDWETMLAQCNLQRHWRVTQVNEKLNVSYTMGTHFVVPQSVNDSELVNAANQFQNDRLPMWCWADSNGCSLVRSAQLRTETELQYWEDKIFAGIVNSDPQGRPYKIIEIDKSCPSCHQVQQSFRKLKNLSMPISQKDFWEMDARWFESLHSSKWLQHVTMTLSSAVQAAKWIREEEQHVILRENNGVDLTSAVSSLVQLMLDPSSRTMEGFQCLIQREWVVAGHPFLDRLGHLLQPTKKNKQSSTAGETTKLAPIFLLFLDCVYQMICQFPSRFEFNATFLTVLHDSTRVTAFETFLFNNELQRRSCRTDGKLTNSETFEPLPVWCWQVQFTDSDRTLFNNPLYKLRMSDNYCQNAETSRELFSPSSSPKKPMRRAPEPPSAAKKPPPLPSNPKPTLNSDEAKPPVAPRRNRPADIPITSFYSSDTQKSPNVYKSSPGSPRLKVRQTVDVEHKMIHEHQTKPLKHHRNKSEDVSKMFAGKGKLPKKPILPKQSSLDRNEHPHTPPMRSKSEGNLFEDDEDVDAEVFPPPTTEKKSPKRKLRFSLRRKRSKDYGSSEILNDEYRICLQKISTLEKEGGVMQYNAPASLYPVTVVVGMKLWKECYMRWVPWSQLYGGGPVAMLQQQSIVYDEIHILNNKVRELSQRLQTTPRHTESCHRDFDNSGMFFCMHKNDSVFETATTNKHSPASPGALTSYFPYTPIKDLRRKSILGTPLSNFLQGGSLFSFGRSRIKIVSPDITNPRLISHNGDEDHSQSSSDVLTPSSVSMDNLTYEAWKMPDGMRDRSQTDGFRNDNKMKKEELKPTRPPMPPPASLKPTNSENITYITSL